MNKRKREMKYLRDRLDHYENQWSRTVTEVKAGIRDLSAQGNADRDRLNKVTARIGRFAETIDDMGGRITGIQLEIIAEHENRLAALEGGARRPDDAETKEHREQVAEGMKMGRITLIPDQAMVGGFMSGVVTPDGGVDPSCFETGHDHTTSSCLGPIVQEDLRGKDTLKGAVERLIDEGPFKPGDMIPAWIAKSEAINTIRAGLMSPSGLVQAEARVRDYMGNHFSTATMIEGVVAALRGGVVRPEDNDSDVKLKSRMLTTECPANATHGSRSSCYAWGTDHWHDKHGVVQYG